MKTVYLVRHAESEINLLGASVIINEESPLSEKGRQQAPILAQRCAKLPVSILIASPQARAKETAQAILEQLDVPVVFSELFIERQFPKEFMGKPRGEIKEQLEEWSKNYFSESGDFLELKKRAGKALAYLSERPEENILVVTHGFFIRTLMAYLIFGEELRADELKKFVKATRTDNTAISVITYGAVPQHAIDPEEERWMIRVYNDHAHLG